jgi:lysozyme family protein|tara:strand:- start:22 stop:549 length:528 start_codon:yes stop_codon:yes gene_type:complete
MQLNYDKCLKTILHHEGGYVNHPKDPGGETNLGVTKRVYEEWAMKNDLHQKDMKDLLVEDVAPIYKKNYWDRIKGDDLPSGLDLCIFDFGVNAGTGRAARMIQTMIGTVADGGIGPNTLRALANYEEEVGGVAEVIKDYQKQRQKYYESLSTFETFGKGWTRRVNETTELALKLI